MREKGWFYIDEGDSEEFSDGFEDDGEASFIEADTEFIELGAEKMDMCDWYILDIDNSDFCIAKEIGEQNFRLIPAAMCGGDRKFCRKMYDSTM